MNGGDGEGLDLIDDTVDNNMDKTANVFTNEDDEVTVLQDNFKGRAFSLKKNLIIAKQESSDPSLSFHVSENSSPDKKVNFLVGNT
jgi:hypothetical protein